MYSLINDDKNKNVSHLKGWSGGSNPDYIRKLLYGSISQNHHSIIINRNAYTSERKNFQIKIVDSEKHFTWCYSKGSVYPVGNEQGLQYVLYTTKKCQKIFFYVRSGLRGDCDDFLCPNGQKSSFFLVY